ncbi:MAG: serine hydrolase [Candidatus Heimdallarchaeota archaeon]|nr:MAG: serine hydrolase [Candidatus Heimdallarchaeota archaeon]
MMIKKKLKILILSLTFGIIISLNLSLSHSQMLKQGIGIESDVKNKSQIVHYNEFNNFTMLKGHAAGVSDVVFSPDGKVLASAGGFDRTIRIWNTSDCSLLSVLNGHLSFVYSLCFSEEGLLASTARDGTIKIWNLTTETVIQTLPIQEEFCNGILFSPDGKLLFSGEGTWGVSGSVRIWNRTSEQIIQNLTGHTDMVGAIAISPLDSRILVSSSRDRTIKFWNTSTGDELRELVNHTDNVLDVAFSVDGKILASASKDETVKLWDTVTGILMNTLEGHEEVVQSVAFSPNGLLASGGGIFFPSWSLNDAEIKIWNVTTATNLCTLMGHTNSIRSLDFSPNGAILASGSEDWTIGLWGSPVTILSKDPFWKTTSPETQGMNSTVLNDMTEYIQRYFTLAHSILVLRNGYLVTEEYYQTDNHIYSRDCKHYIYSCTKSITSLLVGIAIEKGYIDSIHQKVLNFFPDRNISNRDSRKEAMTLEHLLTMTSGMDWTEWDSPSDPANSYRLMVESPDWVQYILDRPMNFDPGEVFTYNTGGSHLLSAIIQNVTGRTTLSFAQEYLFDPLNITSGDFLWLQDPSGIVRGGSGLYLTPSDMVKIGYLYLKNGTWPFNGKQIVSAEWIANATRYNPHLGSENLYGYQVWFTSFTDCNIKSYFAWGFNTQKIYIIPELDLVVVYTSDGFDVQRLIRTFIIPSIFPPVCPEQTSITTTLSSSALSTITSMKNEQNTHSDQTSRGFELIPLLVAVVFLRFWSRRRKT